VTAVGLLVVLNVGLATAVSAGDSVAVTAHGQLAGVHVGWMMAVHVGLLAALQVLHLKFQPMPQLSWSDLKKAPFLFLTSYILFPDPL